MNIVLASSLNEINEISKFRYVIYNSEGYVKNHQHNHLTDIFDDFNVSYNLYCQIDEQIVGSFRITKNSSIGLPTDKYYDFNKVCENHLYASGSFLCVDPKFRKLKIGSKLLDEAVSILRKENYTYLVAGLNPDNLNFFSKNNWIFVDKEMYYLPENRKFVPGIKNLL